MKISAQWNYPTDIRLGRGRIEELAKICRELTMTNPLLVTDRGLVSLAITRTAREILRDGGLEHQIFAEVDPNPTERNVEAGLKVFREGRHDGVVALGGGSAMDLGKCLAFMGGQSQPLWHFALGGDGWKDADPSGIHPIVALPTTAGTGAEVGYACVITNLETRVKTPIFHPRLMPSVVICDPELTVGMPRTITAGTGLDAFSHCLEAYCSPLYHPMAKGIALEGMRLIKEFLPRAYRDPVDLEARINMMSASIMGAVAREKGLGAIHAVSHPINALFNTHHGTTNAVLMPMVLAFNRKAIDKKIDRLASYLGLSGGFDGFCDFITGFRETLGISQNLTELGVPADQIDVLVPLVLSDPAAATNPVRLTEENVGDLLRSCF
ncbi:iron-containing alcohol dehydrogenase [Rhizobium paknamense]|uniref:Alcohol dehydrogenase class IV n=1 Tax=Rhizobium paknamense TaxID=1206817 RepID=A0ABU0IAP7_9HYPH|nr:iron-containing alcohol dehydrogenase [Rhizobium paknamense]MDQ0454748.1 alcohol dehydrogenase class IV [Rhizobium paknamense]